MSERPWIRSYIINGKETTETTYRTPIIEYYTDIKGKTFIDIGAADGYESRAVALRGAKHVLSVEGKEALIKSAFEARDYLGINNLDIQQKDARLIDTYGLGTFDVVLCFGYLYHMDNPFNMLKRLKNITNEILLLETHIAPFRMDNLLAKHVHQLKRDFVEIELDGISFMGKTVYHRGEHAKSKGSLDAQWTFWLTIDSLFKALIRAGFLIRDFHFEQDASAPEVIKKYGALLGYGQANTKIFVVASPKDHHTAKVEEATKRIIKEYSLSEDNPKDLLRRAANRILGYLKK